MKKTHVTIHDIARELNISASTVSRALNDHPRISEATRHAVKKLADKYNYQPNVMASSLRKGRGNTVGVIVPRINRNFFSNVIGGIEDVLSDAGYNLMICQTGELAAKEEEAVTTLINARVNGIIMSLSSETKSYKHLQQLLEKDIHLNFFDRISEEIPVSSVTINDHKGAFLATEHLISMGYKKIACFTGPTNLTIYKDRLNGYLEAMRINGLETGNNMIREGMLIVETGKQIFRDLLTGGEKPEAIVCAGDFAALGIVLAAKEAGLSIPGDLAVTGFANEPFTAFMDPGLSTVEQHGLKMGRSVAELFLEELNNEHEIKNIVLEPELIIRGSSVKGEAANAK